MSKYIISYSGGKGSAASVLLAHENNLDFDVIFADTLIEDEDLYRLNDDIEKIIKKPIIKLTNGKTPWEIFKDKRYIGNNMTAHCSQELKTKMVQNYIKANYKNTWATLILGMGYSEIDRIERARQNWKYICLVDSLLIKYKLYSNTAIDNLLYKYWIKTPRLYKLGFLHNNCGGFCVRAGLKQFALLLQHFPIRFKEHEDAMENTMAAIGPTAKPFLRATIDGVFQYITLKQFREYYYSGKLSISPYDIGGCGCFVDK